MKSVTINQEQKLYVIPCADGYSCLGFEVCDKRAKALEQELAPLGFTVPQSAPVGSLERYAQYRSAVDYAFRLNLENGFRSKSKLTPELVGLEGKRVEVRHRWTSGAEEVCRFIVGKSTGWIPIHLAIPRRDSSGGPGVRLGEILSVRVVGSR